MINLIFASARTAAFSPSTLCPGTVFIAFMPLFLYAFPPHSPRGKLCSFYVFLKRTNPREPEGCALVHMCCVRPKPCYTRSVTPYVGRTHFPCSQPGRKVGSTYYRSLTKQNENAGEMLERHRLHQLPPPSALLVSTSFLLSFVVKRRVPRSSNRSTFAGNTFRPGAAFTTWEGQ